MQTSTSLLKGFPSNDSLGGPTAAPDRWGPWLAMVWSMAGSCVVEFQGCQPKGPHILVQYRSNSPG